jgi:uncharacterized protein involved in outer membrane biogenesis
MKKKILNGLLVAVILLICVSIIGILVLDGVAQSVIQTKGSEGLGVAVKLDSVHIGLFSKSSSLNGLRIANPESFITEEKPDLLTVKEATADFSVLQMFDKEVEIQDVVIEGVVLYLQQIDRKSNIETLINTVSSDKTPEASHPDPPYTIKNFTIRDITVIANGKFTVINSGDVTAHIKEIVMHDIGGDGDAEVATEAITAAITHAIMDHLSKHPAEGFSKLAFSRVTGLINDLPVFHQLGIGNALQSATDTAGKAVDGIIGGINNLFGGGKKDTPAKN